MQQLITGIDIGTGSTKTITIDKDANVISTYQEYYNTLSSKPGYFEQDPEIIWAAFLTCINNTLKINEEADFLISISSAMHGLMVIDKNNKAITPLITWEDIRSEKIAEEIKSDPIAESIYTDTGTPIHAMSPLCKIKWLKENEPDIFKNAAKFISIKEFIWYRLFKTYEIDQSIASATGLFNIKNKKWNEASLELCSIDESQLSEVVSTNFIRKSICNDVANILTTQGKISFCIGASDGCLANIGSGVFDKGIAAVTVGTSGAVRITSEQPLVDFKAMIFNYILDDTFFISGAAVNNGGNVIKWLFKTFLQNDKPSDSDYKNLFDAVERIEAGSNGLLFLPYLYGERAPVWDGNACGVFFGIKSFHTNAHFLKAALEGICYSLNNILEIIEASSFPIHQLNVSGGFVHSKVWLHILADICNKKICIARDEDASSIGAALLGMKAIGLINDYSSLNKNTTSMITPDAANNAIHKKYYNIFKNLYEPLKSSMHQLQYV